MIKETKNDIFEASIKARPFDLHVSWKKGDRKKRQKKKKTKNKKKSYSNNKSENYENHYTQNVNN